MRARPRTRKLGTEAVTLTLTNVVGEAPFTFVAVTPKVGYALSEYVVGAFAALVGTVVEASPTGIDDNLSIPLSVGLALWAGYAFFLPWLDIYRFG